MKLTAEQQQLVLKHMRIAEIEASRFSHCNLPREELLASAYYGLCEAATGHWQEFESYAVISCRNRIRMDLEQATRYTGRQTKAVKWYAANQQFTHDCNPLIRLIKQEEIERLNTAIKSLRINRAVVVLGILEGKTLREISSNTKKTVSTIHSALRSAIRDLRKAMAPWNSLTNLNTRK